ncbi:MAG: hypothetical protein ACJ75J_12595, partial [Cytophagaceae bacterium]
MKAIVKQAKNISDKSDLIILTDKDSDLKGILKNKEEIDYVRARIAAEYIAYINQLSRTIFFVRTKTSEKPGVQKENFRRAGFELSELLKKEKIVNVQVVSFLKDTASTLDFTEGLLLSSYQFLKYKTKKKEDGLSRVEVVADINPRDLEELNNLVKATCIARDLVNEPVVFLTAVQLSKEIEKLGKEAGFKTEILGKEKIKILGMGG